MCDPEFRAALAAAGFTLDPDNGEVAELAPFVGAFSERAAQIGRNIDRYEAEWRTANPGQEPGPAVRRSWDRRAWKDARPDKIAPKDGAELVAAWNQQLRDLGYRDPTAQPGLPIVVGAPRVGAFDRDVAVDTILLRLGARRSAWNAADIRGHAEKAIAAAGIVIDPAARTELAEDVTARVIDACMPLLHQPGVPEHVRALTSRHVLRTEADIRDRQRCVTTRSSRLSRPVSHTGRAPFTKRRFAATYLTPPIANIADRALERLTIVEDRRSPRSPPDVCRSCPSNPSFSSGTHATKVRRWVARSGGPTVIFGRLVGRDWSCTEA